MASAQKQELAIPNQILHSRPQNGTTATLKNHTFNTMELIRSHNWSGRFTTLPSTIKSHDGVARIDHASGAEGSKAGVMYTITGGGCKAYAIALAWHAPTNFNPATSPNRVFAIFGPRSLIKALTWELIVTQLDRSTSTLVINNLQSKNSVHCTIINDPLTNMADLSTDFCIIPVT